MPTQQPMLSMWDMLNRLAKLALGLIGLLALCPGLLAQGGGYTQVTAVIKDPNGALYTNAPYSVTFFDPGTSGKLPLLNGSTFQTSFTGVNTNSVGFMSTILPDNGVIASSSGATGTMWTFSICSQSIQGHQYCFQYQTPISCLDNIPSACSNNTLDISSQLQAVAATLPVIGSAFIQVNGTNVANPNFITSPCIGWTINMPSPGQIQASILPPCQSGGGGGGGGSFASLTSGANTQANMIVGTGATLSASGSGSITATLAPFGGLQSGDNTSASMTIDSGASLSTLGSGTINANLLTSTSVPVNSAANQLLLTTASAVGSWAPVPSCLDSAGQHLNFNIATHMFTCGTSGGTAGSAAFNTLTNGTNTQAAMVIGTGASLSATGSGSIAATSMLFSGLATATNTTAGLVIGTGASLTTSGSGAINANQLSGTGVPVNSAADQYLGTSASATGQWAPMPNCLDAGGNHINYNTTTHSFTCGNTGGSTSSVTFSGITSSTNTSANMLVGTGASLGVTGAGTIGATSAPFSGLTTSVNTSSTLTIGTGAVLASSGSGQINANFLSGTSVPVNSSADQLLGTVSAAVGSWLPVPLCLDSGGNHLNYNTSTHAFSCGISSSGSGGGSSISINGVGTATPNFVNTSAFQFSLAGSNVTGIPIAPGVEGSIILSHLNAFAAVTGFGFDSITSPTTLTNPYILNQTGDTILKGPNYASDIRTFGARAATVNTTSTGSGTSLTVPVTSLINGDGLAIAGGGAACAIAAPTGLAVATGAAGGMTVPDAVMFTGMTNASTYNYVAFAVDALGCATVPTSITTTTTGPTALGETQFSISTWSLLGNTLTIVTSSSSGLPIGTLIHLTGTSNNTLAGGWYPISAISGATITINNVPQYAATTTSGTGGTVTAFLGNTLTWTRSTGGTIGTTNVPWRYFVCAQRPGDGSLHIIGSSFPSTFFAESNSGNFSNTFVDFGTTLSANPIIPWYLSDANCTAGAAQNEVFSTTVAGGGGTSNLTLASPLPNSVTSAAVRLDNAPALVAAANAARASLGTLYIPIAGSGFPINSFVNLSYAINIWQAGSLTVNDTILVKGSTNWFGQTGSSPTPAFGFNGAPIITCNAWPCIYVGDIANQGSGGTTFDTLTVQSTQNGLDFLVDANWGMIWNKVNFVSGQNNNDNMGMGLVIRPGGANYTINNSNFVGGPNQVIDQTWAPLFFADRGHAGCCGGAGNTGNITMTNTQWNRRGAYYLANGGDGVHFSSFGRFYSQGGITPRFTAQNTNGNVNGQVQIDNMFHDTESQATYAWICNSNCSGGFGVPFHLGFANEISQDAGTIPGQITGGGNQGIMEVVGTFGPGGIPVNTAFGPSKFGLGWIIQNGTLVPTLPVSLNTGIFTGNDIRPNVPTPELTMENGAFVGNLTAPITANRTWLWPDTNGIVCVSGLQGCDYFLDTGVANAYAFCPSPIPLTNYVIGQHFTIQVANGNTGASTVNACSLGAKTVKKNGGTGGSVGVDLVTGDWKTGQFEQIAYDGTNFQCLTCGGTGGSGGTVSTTGSPASPELAGFSGATTITNVNLSGDVTTTNTLATTVAKIQGVTVNTSSVQVGQILNVGAGPQYINQYPGVNYDPQSGATYPIACPGDRLGEVDFTGSSAAVFTLLQAGSTACMSNSASFLVHNGGTAPLTLAATASTIDGIAGATGVQILQGEARYVYSDNTNFHTVKVPTSFGGINTQTTNYTAVAGDYNKLILMNCGSACTLTLPATPPITGETSAATRWNIRVLSIGASLATISLNGLTFNGSASVPLLNKDVIQDFQTDGSNYFGSAPLVAGSGITFTPAPQGLSIISTSSGGSVTNVATSPPLAGGPITTTGTLTCTTCVTSASALTNNQLMAGAGSQGSKVTDLTGDVTTSGALATTLATVNSNVGTLEPATITVNAKGLVTAVLAIANVTTTVGISAIGANTCTSTTTVTMTGVASTMTFSFTPNADVSGVTGWGSTGGLVIDAWPTTNTLNYKVCNQTAASITPSGSVIFNVSAR